MRLRLHRLIQSLELPLLVKELNEQASRPRTYLIRFVYATLLFAAACALFFGNFLGEGGGATGALGRGRFLFERLVTLQLWCIYLFLPAISCGALTTEKERNTLGLLLITSLSPWQIFLQKILGRVVPMLTFVLLSFPLMAIAYSFGGVTEDYLWSGIFLLILTCLQVGCLAVACSAYFPSTVEAFIGHFVIFLVLSSAVPLGWAPELLRRADQFTFGMTAASSFLLIMLTGGFFFAGWMSVESRAFVPPKNVLLQMFKRLDAWFNDMNKVTGGVILVRDGDPLPGVAPVAWRETAKKSLGTFRYLFRVLVAIELPLLLICSALRLASPGGADLQPVSGFLYVLWILGTSMIVVHAGSLISSEKTRQTLDVLLATPLEGRDLILQKLRGVRRLMGVLLVPFSTIFIFETWWNQGATFRWLYLPLALASVLVYLPLVTWFALAIGLKVRSQMKGVIATLALFGIWLLTPVAVQHLATNLLGMPSGRTLQFLLTLNPSVLIPAIESAGGVVINFQSKQVQPPMPLWLAFVLNLGLHGGACYALRSWCLKHADRLLGRLGTDETAPPHAKMEVSPLSVEPVAT
ncbi:MAG: ABC transporter permease subunit [Planctomycetales bacterium]